MRGRIEAVRLQQEGVLALARGSWRAQSGVGRVSSFLTAGFGISGGEVLRAEGIGFRLAEAGLPNPEVGLSRTPPLLSVLGGQAGREEELRTKHLRSLGALRGPGQVWPHVRSLSAFCSSLCLVLSFLLLLQRGWSRPCQGKGENYKGPGCTPSVCPLLPAQKAQGCATVQLLDVTSISLTRAAGTRR